MNNPGNQINTLRSKLDAGERDVDDKADRKILLEFSDELQLLKTQYTDHRHLKLLRHCTRMAEHVGGLADALEEKDAAEDIVRWIHATYDNEETNQDYRVALKVFGRRVSDANGDDPPESLEWVPSTTSRSYNPSPDPAEMLVWDDDVKPMIDAARNSRDKALIAVQFDAGLRGGELYDLTIGDVSDSEHSVKLRVDGKTGQRSVDLIPSVPYLNRWIADHPADGDPDAFLWSKLSTAERYSYQRFLQGFKEPAERAGVTKPVTPTNFRKSNATWLASQGANAALIEDRQGRTRGSDAVARYVATFGDEAEKQYAAMHGLDVDLDEPEEIAPLTCPRCDKETPRDKDLCVWCGQALSPEAADEVTAQDRRFFDSAAGAEGDLLDDVAEARELLDEQPALRRLLLDD
ncbi:tyrosine-type recombinase/integrase [Halostella sp. PRR32]|uniref:tyrosine-type recombinase/integrase n=1 Tax=Halostella sp. PRR32 TaxID=3098147 RepID=UPI002B1D1159|nr:tyrosine-type recombinase/integrase [Halostella sp. PRR32]